MTKTKFGSVKPRHISPVSNLAVDLLELLTSLQFLGLGVAYDGMRHVSPS